MDEDFQSNRNVVHRYFLVKADDSGSDPDIGNAQHRDVVGLDDQDAPTKVLTIQPHGFASVPVADAHMVGFSIGNQRDNLMLIGGEHPDHMPKNLGDGNSAMYNSMSAILKLLGDNVEFDANGDAVFTFKSFSVKCGGCTFKFDGDGFHQTSGKQDHDGHDVGKTHLHKDTQPGGGLSGEPQ